MVATLYWHNLTGDNDGSKRENYSTDIAGTVPAIAGSTEFDDLRFDGSGAGNSAAWTIAAAGTLTCNSLRVGGAAVTYTVDATASVMITDEFSTFSGGTTAAWGGSMSVGRITQLLNSFSSTDNPCALTLTGSEITRDNPAPGNTSRTLFANLTLTQETTVTSAGVNDADLLELRGTIVGGQKIVKAGSRELQLNLPNEGRTSYVSSVDIAAGILFILQNANSGAIIQGIGGVGGEPSACPITLVGNDTTLRYGCSNNGTVQWGNPLLVSAAVTGARLLFQGTGNAAVQHIYFPITMGSDLLITRGPSVGFTVSMFGPTGWAGTGTLHADGGKIMGSGKLTVERPNGLASNLSLPVLYDTGARVEHTGGTLITSPTTSYSAAFGYQNLPPGEVVSIGTGEVEVNRNAALLVQGVTTGAPFVVTNDIRCTGNFTHDTAVPTLFLGRSGAGNPTCHFTGMLTIDCPQIFSDTGAGGGGQQHTFLGGITLLQAARIRWSGANGQDFVIGSDITGAFDLTLWGTNPNGMVRFASVQTVPRNYIVIAGAGGIAISHTEALKSALSLEILSGGQVRFDASGVTLLDGVLLFRQGSVIRFLPAATALQLNGVGVHEWSCTMFDPALARAFEIRLPTDTTAVAFNPATSPLPTPLFRITGNTTFQTANPSTTSIRPGQDASGGLPGGVSVMFLERGKTLTIDTPLILSMYRGEGVPTGAAGVATIAGTGRLVFTQQNGWAPTSSYGLAEFDINVSFAGSDANTTLNITGFTALKDLRTESSTVNLTAVFTDCTVAGDFYTFTSIAGGTGNTVVRWAGTSEVTGDYYQRQLQIIPSGLHRMEILANASLTVGGDFRPMSDKVGGTGGMANPRTTELFGGENFTLTLRGNVWIRSAQSAHFFALAPLAPAGYANLGKIVYDLTNQDIEISDEFGGFVANAEVVNTSGIPRTISLGLGAWWYNHTTVLGNDITLDTTANDTYGLNISAAGTNNHLILGDYVDSGFTFSYAFSAIPPAGLIDFRGFASVDVTANTWFGVYPNAAIDLWFDGAAFSGVVDAGGIAFGAITFHDAFVAATLQAAARGAPMVFNAGGLIQVTSFVVRTGNGAFPIVFSSPVTAQNFVFSNNGASVSAITLNDILTVHGSVSFAPGTVFSAAPGWFVYEPKGAGNVRALQFGGVSIPPLRVQSTGPEAEPAYGVALADHATLQPCPRLELLVSGVTDLVFQIGGHTHVQGDWTASKPGAGALTIDWGGKDLRLTGDLTFGAGVQGAAPALSQLILVAPVLQTITPGAALLPRILHRAVAVSLGSDVTAVAFLMNHASTGQMRMNGRTLTTSGQVLISRGTFDASLSGARFVCGSFLLSEVLATPAAPWYVDSVNQPVAEFTTMSNSVNESVDIGEASSSEDGGGNVRWSFGGLPAALLIPTSRLGLGLGLVTEA